MASRPGSDSRIRFSTATEVHRVTIEPDSILLEGRDLVGGFQPTARVFWDEIKSVYLWEATNWSTIVVGLMVSVIALIPAPFMVESGWAWAWAAGCAIMFGLFVLAGVRVWPRQWVKIESTQAPMLLTTRRQEFIDHLLSRIPRDPEEGGVTPQPPGA